MNDDINTIFNAHKENKTVIEDLINSLNSGSIDISPFIGAGMSVPIYPLWKDALKTITEDYHISVENKKKIREHVAKNQYELAASVIKASLNGIRYNDALRHIFKSDKISENQLKTMAVSMLPQLFHGTIFTTNYERVLNKVYSCETQITMDSLSHKRTEVLRSRERLHIVKLHGDIDESRIIFTNEDYDEYYGENLDTPNVDYLHSLFASKTMLFLGCGLKEDRTFSLLKKLSTRNEYPHYALLEMEDAINSDKFSKREAALSDANIRCIWYPKKQHQLVKAFLQYLIDHTQATSKASCDKSLYNSLSVSEIHAIQQQTLLQNNIVGISGSSKLKDVLSKCYIDPDVRVNNVDDMTFSMFARHYSFNGGVALLAAPGMGKSTALKAIIINEYYAAYPDVLFYYLEAKDFITQSADIRNEGDNFIHIIHNKFPQSILPDDVRIVLLIDSCDELPPTDRKNFIETVHKWSLLLNAGRAVWISCRFDYYIRYFEKSFSKIINTQIHIQEWTPDKSNAFIEDFLSKDSKTEEQITSTKKLISDFETRNPTASFWRKNPFYLSLFLFCVVGQNINEYAGIRLDNAYELYGLFYTKWFERHHITTNQKKIKDAHTQIALSLYNQKGDALRLSGLLSQDTIRKLYKERAFRDLLWMNSGAYENSCKIEDLKVNRFWHESFGDYLIAVDLLDFLKNPSTQKVISKKDFHLSNIVNNDVNIFIKEAFCSFSSETTIAICEKLLVLYFQLQIGPKEHLKERCNLLYYIGRLSAKIATDKDRLFYMQKAVLLNALNFECDYPMVKRTAIISLMNIYKKDDCEIENKIIEYISALTPNSPADLTNRSIQLVYCGDIGYDEDNNVFIEFGDLKNFSDTKLGSWVRTKQYILNRLVKDDRVSMIYRLWDLRTLYLFFESRNWETLEKKDVSIVRDTCIDNNTIFSEDMQKLLAKEKAELLKLMKGNIKT